MYEDVLGLSYILKIILNHCQKFNSLYKHYEITAIYVTGSVIYKMLYGKVKEWVLE